MRALIFYEFRADYFTGGSDIGESRIREVIEAIRLKAAEPET